MKPVIVADGPVEFSIYGPMICGSAEAEARTYRLIAPEKGPRWVVAVQGNPADNIYKDGGKGSDGFAGRTLTFPLEDGTSVSFIGPWKCGADALYEATGVDVRNQYLTLGIIALRRENGIDTGRVRTSYHNFYDVLHVDADWSIGAYNRIDCMAQDFADTLGVKVWFSTVSKGGGHASWKDPKPTVDNSNQGGSQ